MGATGIKNKFVGFPRLDESIPETAESLGADRDAKRTYRHRVSQASDCVRNLVLGIRGVPADVRSGRMEIILDDSTNHEDLTFKWLDKTNFPVGMRQHPVNIARIPTSRPVKLRKCETCGQNIRSNELHGHIDGGVEDGEFFLLEHKAISTYRFDRLGEDERQPEDYVQQCCGYLVGLQNQGYEWNRAILLIKNKNSGTYKQYGITYDRKEDTAQVVASWTGEAVYYKGVVKELIAKHIIVQRAIDNPESPLPDRPYAFDSFNCQWCRRRDRCWESYPEEIEKRQDSSVDPDSELAQQIRRLTEARQVAREADEVAKRLRQDVAVALQRMNLKSGGIFFDDGSAINFAINASRRSYLDRGLIPPEIAARATRFNLAEYVTTRFVGKKGK